MKRTITIIVLLIIIVGAGYLYLKSGTPSHAANNSNVQPPSNASSDVNVCIGSAEYCQGVANAKQQEVQNANDQYILMMTQQAPTSIPTLSPEDVALHQQQSQAMTDVLVTAMWAAVILVCLGGLAFLAFQIYWHFRVKIPKDEQAPDIRREDSLIVARLPGDVSHADRGDQFLAIDKNAFGTMMVFINDHGIAIPLLLTDAVGSAVAFGHAFGGAATAAQQTQLIKDLQRQWNDGTARNLHELGDAAANWRSAGRDKTPARQTTHQRVPPPRKTGE